MKTLTSARTLALLAATLALGSFGAIALAGPGPQYWNKAPAPAAPATPKCTGCTTTRTTPFASNVRGPREKARPTRPSPRPPAVARSARARS